MAGRNTKQYQMTKMTFTCHPEAKPKDLANEKEILRFAQNDSKAVGFENLNIRISNLFRISGFVLRAFHYQ